MTGEPMRGQDVPADLVREASNAQARHISAQVGRVVTLDETIRAVLAAVLPEIERQVRAKVAAEIEGRRCGMAGLCEGCRCRCEDAETARGGA